MKERTGQKKKVSFGIMAKIMLIGFIPLLTLAVSLAAFSAKTIRKGMRDEAIKRLEDVSVGLQQALSVAGEGDYRLDGADLYKGEHNISADLPAFEAFSNFSNIDLTVCWGDTRR